MHKKIVIKWKDEEYVVKSKKIMRLLFGIEQHVTLCQLANPISLSNVAVARAYSFALHFSGADVSEEEVYEALFDKEHGQSMKDVLDTLMMMLVPPESYQKKEIDEEKKPQNLQE